MDSHYPKQNHTRERMSLSKISFMTL